MWSLHSVLGVIYFIHLSRARALSQKVLIGDHAEGVQPCLHLASVLFPVQKVVFVVRFERLMARAEVSFTGSSPAPVSHKNQGIGSFVAPMAWDGAASRSCQGGSLININP